MWGALSDERTGMPFTIAAGPRQRSHSWVRVPRLLAQILAIRADSRLLQPAEADTGRTGRLYCHTLKREGVYQAFA
jgi:hypothetical protein